MTADPRDMISEFTETTDKKSGRMIGSLFLAIGWGALAGGVCGKILQHYRESLTQRQGKPDETADPPTNPYHDMIY